MHYIVRTGAKRRAHTNFLCPSGDFVGNDAVESHCAENQREQRGTTKHRIRDTCILVRSADLIHERHCFRDRNFRIDACDGLSDHRQSRCGIARNAYAHAGFEKSIVLPERKIRDRERKLDGTAHLGVFDKANDFIRLVVNENGLPQRQTVSVDLTRECFVHDGDQGRARLVGIVEIASGDKWNLERCEVIGRNGLSGDHRLVSGLRIRLSRQRCPISRMAKKTRPGRCPAPTLISLRTLMINQAREVSWQRRFPVSLIIVLIVRPWSAVPSTFMPLPSRSTSAGPPVVRDTAVLPCSSLPPTAKETRSDCLCPDGCAPRGNVRCIAATLAAGTILQRGSVSTDILL